MAGAIPSAQAGINNFIHDIIIQLDHRRWSMRRSNLSFNYKLINYMQVSRNKKKKPSMNTSDYFEAWVGLVWVPQEAHWVTLC
jgi:hypothetical protein